MQRTAQDWLVLTELTHHNATAVGIVMALQFGPQLLLLPLTGFAADHLDRRKLLFATQAAMGAAGARARAAHASPALVQLWHVYVFAFLLGCVAAFDAPARQTFVAELVGERDLSERGGAQLDVVQRRADDRPGRRRRPDRRVGTGWVFLINAASFVAVLCSLACCASASCTAAAPRGRRRGSFAEGFRYVWRGPTSRRSCSCCS